MKKYLKVYSILIGNAFSRDVQFRVDTWITWLTHIAWCGLLFVLVDVLFRFTNGIVGWTKPEVFLLVIIFTLSQQFFHFFFRDNMWELPNIITDGKLDAYLVSPVNSIFLATSRQVATKAIPRIFTQGGILVWALLTYDYNLTFWSSLGLVTLVIVGLIIQAAFFLIINSLSFWFLRIDNINDAWFNLAQLGRYPLSVLPQILSVLALTAFPIAYQSFVPVGFGLGKLDARFFLLAIGWALLLCIIARNLWDAGLKNYESASG